MSNNLLSATLNNTPIKNKDFKDIFEIFKTPKRQLSTNDKTKHVCSTDLPFLMSPRTLNPKYQRSGLVNKSINYELYTTPVVPYNRSHIDELLEKDSHQNSTDMKINLPKFDQQIEYEQSADESIFSNEEQENKEQNEDNESDQQNSKEFLYEKQIKLNEKSNKNGQNSSLFDDQKEENKKFTPCNCKKTQCLKLYCDCFRDGRTCGQECNCVGCHNDEEHIQEIQKSKELIMKRDKFALQKKILDQKHSKGCNCKKSGCQKKYCECYQANIKCSDSCKCQGCQNCLGDQIQEEIPINITSKKSKKV